MTVRVFLRSIDLAEIHLDEARSNAEERNRWNHRGEVTEKDLEISGPRRRRENHLRGARGDAPSSGVADRQQAGECVPVETQKTKLLLWEKTRFLVVDHKTHSRKKLKRYLQKREAFFLG